MAGIYIHIPFCRQACHYCDFHFSTNLSRKREMVSAIAKEIEDRSSAFRHEIRTIYFGGGTPSLLSSDELDEIMLAIEKNYSILQEAEVTLEANPEDLTTENSSVFFESGINRLSIGMQTFEDDKLKWMNRAHDATQSIAAFNNARKAGFSNISLDLIYALPKQSKNKWVSDLTKITDLNPEHISMYGLTVESDTVFGKWERDSKLVEVTESQAADQYLEAIQFLADKGFQQYEVSNFGKEDYYSRHNHAYWSGAPYLGVGPGAHSFDGKLTRKFNIRNNAKYIKGISENNIYFEEEQMTTVQRQNERILTGLRTKKGIKVSEFDSDYKGGLLAQHDSFIQEMTQKNLIKIEDGFLSLRPNGFLVADEIALRLFSPE